MKLSMWMIANRLSSLLDIETEIRQNAKPVLNSARLVYATNCVHVYRENKAIVYEGEGDRIRLYDLSIKEAFEILQGVFDFYQDWESRVQEDIAKRDYQALVDHSDILFQNPLILMNANYRRLGMSSCYDDDDMDEEWRYIRENGYSSLTSVRKMRGDSSVSVEDLGARP